MDRSEQARDDDRYDLRAIEQIIREASRIQHERLETLSRAELEQIAAELQINAEDVAKAIDVIRNQEKPANEMNWFERLKQPVVVVLAAAAAGSATAILVNQVAAILTQPYRAYAALAALICLACAEVSVAYSLSGKLKHVTFQLTNLALWGGWTSVCFSVGHSEGGIPGIFIAAVAAVFGSALITARGDGSQGKAGGALSAVKRWFSRKSTELDSPNHDIYRQRVRWNLLVGIHSRC